MLYVGNNRKLRTANRSLWWGGGDLNTNDGIQIWKTFHVSLEMIPTYFVLSVAHEMFVVVVNEAGHMQRCPR